MYNKNMNTPFSSSLKELRKEAGFPSAYRFYHGNGGGGVMKFSYRAYLRFEQGEVLPSPMVLSGLYPALKLIPGSSASMELAAAWLKTMAGEEAYRAVFAQLIPKRPDPPGLSPLHKVMKKSLSDKKYPLSVKEASAILLSEEHYRCFLAMISAAGKWSAETLGKTVGIPKAAAEKIISDFIQTGLMRKAGGKLRSFRCVDKMVEFPRAEILPPGLHTRMKGYQTALIAAGETMWRRLGILRADADALADLYPVMALNMSAAQAYAVTGKTPKSALFAIEGRVVKLFDF